MEEKKMDVLVVGASGSGKTTLINAIAGVVEPDKLSKKIDIYESSEWPMRFIDTKGLEVTILEQLNTLLQFKKMSSKQIKAKKATKEEGLIEAVWLCVEGTSGVTIEHNIKLMLKGIKTWKKVPIFVVLTKSYSEPETKENIKIIKKIFEEEKNTNLKEIIPVVAKPYIINKEYTVTPIGVDKLCSKTLDVFDEAGEISKKNKKKFELIQKRFNAQSLIVGATAVTAGISFIDKNNKFDSASLTGIEPLLANCIFKIYNLKINADLMNLIMKAGGISSGVKYIVGYFDKTKSQIADTAVASLIIFVVGEAYFAASEACYNGLIKVDDIPKFVEDRIRDTKYLGKLIKYYEDNKENLINMKLYDLLSELTEETEKPKKKKAKATA